MSQRLLLPVLGVLLIVLPARAIAQSGTAGLTGTVTDPSGTAMDRVQIVVMDPTTGFSRETETNRTGNYNIAGLRPGTYDIAVTRDGFRKFTQAGFRIEVSQIARLDVRLEIGQITESVEISGRTPLLETEGGTLGAVIDSRKIADLPLNGRNFVQLALLVPGVNTGQPGAGRGGGISINGTRSEQNSFQLDGVTNTDQWDSGISFRPSVDSIQEFKIEVSSYAAEFGRGAGGQISVVTKSGTNELHGNLYEFNRNDALQARNFFDRNPNFVDRRGNFKPPPLNRNEFGGILGGPVIPNRTFFFADYQGTRQVRASVGRRTVPEGAFMAGDLSAVLGPPIGTDLLGRPVLRNQIYDPRTSRLVRDPRTGRSVFIRDPYPNNQIPISHFDPIALRILQSGLWPAPNAAGTRDARTGNPRDNYFDNRPTRFDGDQFLVRIDHRFSPNDAIFVRFGLNDTDDRSPGCFPGNERLSLNRQQVFAASHTKVFGASKVNELRFGYLRERPQNGAVRILAGEHLVSQLGIAVCRSRVRERRISRSPASRESATAGSCAARTTRSSSSSNSRSTRDVISSSSGGNSGVSISTSSTIRLTLAENGCSRTPNGAASKASRTRGTRSRISCSASRGRKPDAPAIIRASCARRSTRPSFRMTSNSVRS